jgi:hypothetical protein
MTSGSQSGGTGRSGGILPLAAHLNIVAATGIDLVRLDPRARVRDDEQLSAMKAHIADLYAGVEAVHSFEDIGGTVFDCIPVEQQPALRGHVGPIPQPPDLTQVLYGGAPQARPAAPVAEPETVPRDRHGNKMLAPEGTIPFPRVTLEGMGRFETLDGYFRKHPGATTVARAPGVLSDQPAETGEAEPEHRYARVDQESQNIGGHSSFAAYAPAVASDEIFSLSQHWYVAGSGAGTQTVEVGWQVYPAVNKHALPALFIYWTADQYKTTGNYNLTKTAFVATKSGEPLIGAVVGPTSVRGGQQMELDITVYLYEGNWWIYVGGVEPQNALGYYPTSLYSGGPMATAAERFQCGGETCSGTVGSWPEMGSGALAEEGWEQAAYHRAAYYFPPTGGSAWAASMTGLTYPGMYTLGPQPWESRTTAAMPWGAYFFYGGPGE